MPENEFDYITVHEACSIVGGKRKPIHPVTYYRNANLGLLPKPEHPTPGVSRISRPKLLDALRRQAEAVE